MFGALTAFAYWVGRVMGHHPDVVILLIIYGVMCIFVVGRVIQIFRSQD